MDGFFGEDLGDDKELVPLVEADLFALRSGHGILSPQKLAAFPNLVRVCGGGDLLDAFLMFQRELRRYVNVGRDEAAAAISISAPADTVLDRLEHVVSALPQDGKFRDQRTARRWSDQGIRTIASDLAYMARVQGRLGTELLAVEIRGDKTTCLELVIDQMTKSGLAVRAPLVRLWQYVDDEPVEGELVVDLDETPASSATKHEYTMHRYRVTVQVPSASSSHVDRMLLGLSIEGRDAPMRTVALEDRTVFDETRGLRLTVYRTIVSVELLLLAGDV